ncbi:MAG: MFS transporter [Trueperaceae bacterium]|nr:MAG: MFS transporter [Trueperaceae bacterium]
MMRAPPSARRPRDPVAARRRRELWRAVYLPTVVLSLAEGMLVPVLPLYVADLGAGFALVGLALAAEAIGMLLGDVPAGSILRRFDRKVVMLTGVGVVGVAVAAIPLFGSVVAVIVLRLVAGLGAAMWGLSRHAYLTESVEPASRGRSIAAFGGANRIGMLLGPALGGVVAGAFGFGAAFIAFGIVAALAFGLCALYLEPRSATETGPRQRMGHREALRHVLVQQRRLLITAGAGQLFAQMIRSGRRIVLPLYGSALLGLDVQAIGWVLSIAAAFDVALFPVAGVVMDRWGRKAAIVPSFVIQALGMALVPLSGGVVGLALAGAVIGLGNGIGSGTMMTIASDLAPRDTVGEFLGVWRLIGDAGGMGGPVAVGAIADALTLETATLVIAVIGLGAAATFAFGVPETLGRAPVAARRG